ncbi:MAG: transposase [bacterium]|nr:transposase [bacterium]
MTDSREQRRRQLREAGLLHPDPNQVRDPLFEQRPAFFDAEDRLQVRYEMLRAHLLDGEAIRAICQRFGVSRQTFYNLQAKFLESGTAGLLPKRAGPKGPRKLTAEVLAFVSERLQSEEPFSTPELQEEIQTRFSITLHRRTLEKLVKDLRTKKNGGS